MNGAVSSIRSGRTVPILDLIDSYCSSSVCSGRRSKQELSRLANGAYAVEDSKESERPSYHTTAR